MGYAQEEAPKEEISALRTIPAREFGCIIPPKLIREMPRCEFIAVAPITPALSKDEPDFRQTQRGVMYNREFLRYTPRY